MTTLYSLEDVVYLTLKLDRKTCSSINIEISRLCNDQIYRIIESPLKLIRSKVLLNSARISLHTVHYCLVCSLFRFGTASAGSTVLFLYICHRCWEFMFQVSLLYLIHDIRREEQRGIMCLNLRRNILWTDNNYIIKLFQMPKHAVYEFEILLHGPDVSICCKRRRI